MSLELIEEVNKLIKQTQKEALEIKEKRVLIKSKIFENSIEIDFIIDCLTKKRYDDLTYNERLFVNDIFENATKEDLKEKITIRALAERSGTSKDTVQKYLKKNRV